MSLHYFHCTNGTDLVLDRRGRQARTREDVEPIALTVAGRLMKRAPGAANWSEWSVSVQDSRGSMVAVIPFPAGQA